MILLESYVSGSRRSWCIRDKNVTGASLLEALALREGCVDDVVLQCEGRVLVPTMPVPDETSVRATLRLRGGKGGFGSMLRAIGAQIEKTTNREACRDLSGRRLRDINEEKRLKDFISKKADREREAQERKRQKFETLKHTPKHNFEDQSYFQQREKREKNLYDSLDKAFSSNSGNGSGPSGVKRGSSTMNEDGTTVRIKKGKFVDDLDESSEEDTDEDDEVAAVPVVRLDSNSDSEDSRPAVKSKDTTIDNSSDSAENGKIVAEGKQNSSPLEDDFPAKSDT